MEPPTAVVITAAQAAALGRAQALAAELVELVAALREPPRAPPAAASVRPPEPDETLAAGELRAAFSAVTGAPARRPRWMRDMLG